MFALSVLTVLILLWRAYRSQRRILGGSLEQLQATMLRIGRGDLTLVVEPVDDSGGSVMASLLRMQHNLATLHEENRKLTSQALLYQDIVQSTDDAVIGKTLTGVITSWNPGAEIIFGYTAQEMIGQSIIRLIPPDRVDEEDIILGKILAGETLDHFQTIRIRKDGVSIHISATISPIRDGSGKIIGASKIARDFTAQKQWEARLTAMFNATVMGVILIDQFGHILEFSPSCETLFGYAKQEVLGQDVSILMLEPHHSAHGDYIRHYLQTGQTKIIGVGREVLGKRRDGSSFPMELYVDEVLTGTTRNFVGFINDISERKRAEEALRIAATTFKLHDAILITDAAANIVRTNAAFEKTTGYTEAEVLGKNPSIMSSGRHNKAFFAQMWRELLQSGSWSGELWDRHKDGHVYPKRVTISAVKDSTGNTTQYVSIFSDISSHKRAEEEIYNLAFFDALTGLPNRRSLYERLRAALTASAHSKKYGALVFLDLDKFKTLNDTLGHDCGDLLLEEVASRLKRCVRDVDTVARLGGDEFVILIESLSIDSIEASQLTEVIVEDVRTSLSSPYVLGAHLVHSSPSIGICMFFGDTITAHELIKRADIAMYEAKDAGRNQVRFFDPSLQQSLESRAAIESDLRQAILKGQLRLHYQIQVDQDLKVVGTEALIRWQHPNRGMVSPAEFIPLAEESSLILEIGRWVMDTACRQLANWAEHPHTENLTIAVNVSALEFKQPDFVEQVKAVIDAYGIDPARLKIELTESIALDDIYFVQVKMMALRHVLGISLSLDDFGTGYSSLAYLRRLPFDQVKIDQRFVRDMLVDHGDAVMVKTIIDMAKNLDMNAIAEGVETEEHLELLLRHGCVAFQGYLLGKPMPIEALERQLAERWSKAWQPPRLDSNKHDTESL